MKTIDASKPTCRVVSAAAQFMGKQGHFLAPGISAQSVGAQGINLQIAIIPRGGRSKVHKHEQHETAIQHERHGKLPRPHRAD